MDKVDRMDRAHALYRFFSSDGRLLYIGITVSVLGRWAGHERDKPWWPEVASATLTHYPSREAVLAAEREAIVAEQPEHNVVHNSQRGDPRTSNGPMSLDEYKELCFRGDVLAIGTPTNCPVGIVTRIGHRGIRLKLMSFFSGEFELYETIIRWEDCLKIVIAAELSTEYGRRRYDTEPLGKFQTAWNESLESNR